MACAVPPASGASRALGTLAANQSLLGEFLFSSPFEPFTSDDTQSIKHERLPEPGLGTCFSYIRSLEE